MHSILAHHTCELQVSGLRTKFIAYAAGAQELVMLDASCACFSAIHEPLIKSTLCHARSANAGGGARGC